MSAQWQSPAQAHTRRRLLEKLNISDQDIDTETAMQGVSSSLARELLESAGPGAVAADELTAEQWDALWVAWGAWLDRVEAGRYTGTRDPATGRLSVLGSYSEGYESVHEMIDESYRCGLRLPCEQALKTRVKCSDWLVLRIRTSACCLWLQSVDSACANTCWLLPLRGMDALHAQDSTPHVVVKHIEPISACLTAGAGPLHVLPCSCWRACLHHCLSCVQVGTGC